MSLVRNETKKIEMIEIGFLTDGLYEYKNYVFLLGQYKIDRSDPCIIPIDRPLMDLYTCCLSSNMIVILFLGVATNLLLDLQFFLINFSILHKN